MASSGGKKVKKKWKTMPLDEIIESAPVRKMTWADEVDREIDVDSSDYMAKPNLPTAPRASRPTIIDESKIPTSGPFHAYVSNIPYEMTENELAAVFKDLKIKSVRLPKEDRGGNRARGFGYIEFDDRASLIAALTQGDTMVKGRQIHVDVATSVDGGGRGRGGRNRDGGPRDNAGPDRTSGNWRSGPRSEEFDDREGGGYERSQFARRDFGVSGFRGGVGFEDRFSRDDKGGGGFGGREERNFQRDERGGGFSGSRDERFNREERYSREDRGFSNFERSYRDRGFPRDDERAGGGGFGREERYSREDRGPSYGRFEDRKERESRFGPKREERPDLTKGSSTGEQKMRTKLNLQPRSNTSSDQSGSSTSNTSIFGGAKPVDTSAKDREIEERLAKNNEELGKNPQGSKEKSGDWVEERKAEPAPPPKENAWSRKTNTPPVNNGRSSPEDDAESLQHNNKEEVTGKRMDHSEPKRLETKRSDYSGKGAHKGPERTREKDLDRHSNKQSDPRKAKNEELKMPKIEETKVPNFAGENKFSSLITDEGFVD